MRIILEKDDLKVLKVETQKSVENLYGRSVRFDVFATDTKGKKYNIEVQRADSGAIPQRARYNSVMLDYHELKKQDEFKELPESFVVFITENDVIGDGLKIYHADRIIRETNKELGDGTHIIYVNCSFKGEKGKPLDDLIHDFFCDNPKDMRHRQLAKRVEFFKENKIGVSSMSSIIAEFFKDEIAEAKAEGKAEGKETTLIENIRNAMQSWNLSAEAAMDGLKVPPEVQKQIRPLI